MLIYVRIDNLKIYFGYYFGLIVNTFMGGRSKKKL